MTDVGDIVAGVSAAIAALSASIAAVTYRGQARSRRTEYLLDLRRRLDEGDSFRLVRRGIHEELYRPAGARASLIVQALTKKHSLEHPASSPDASVALTDEETHLLLALQDYLNFFEVLEQLLEASRLDELDAYFAFTWHVESALRIDAVANEVRLYYPATRRLGERFKRVSEREYGMRWKRE